MASNKILKDINLDRKQFDKNNSVVSSRISIATSSNK
jgi:hypothetical protein